MNSDPRMRRFQSHKVVQAGLLYDIEFLSVDEADLGYDLGLNGNGANAAYGRRVKSPGLRHRLPGEQYEPNTFYVVLYEDGYVSFCPRETFEAGHTEIGDIDHQVVDENVIHANLCIVFDQLRKSQLGQENPDALGLVEQALGMLAVQMAMGRPDL